jgi:hypothetical protein
MIWQNSLSVSLVRTGLKLNNLVAQCYDGASNMRGQFSEVQKHIKDIAGEQALYIWCWAHSLNLVLETYVKRSCIVALKTFGVLQQLCVYIETFPIASQTVHGAGEYSWFR